MKKRILIWVLLSSLILTASLYAQTAGTQQWTFTTGDKVRSSPTIGSDGTIYVGSYDNKLYAINPDGMLKWAFTTGGRVYSSPAIGSDGTIYVGSWDDKQLYAIKPDGTQQWAFTTGDIVLSSPAIGNDGTIYVGSWDNKLYAINTDGTQQWAFTTGNWIYSSPAISSDGTIYVGSCDSNLYAINPDGTQQWAFTTGNIVRSSPAIGSDGTIYVGSWDNKLYAIKPDGTLKWAFTAGNIVRSSPAIGSDGTIYVGSDDYKLYAIKPDGTQRWAFTTGSYVYSAPAIGSDGTIYVGSWDNKLYAIKPDGTQRWAFATGSYVYSAPAVGSDGTIYVGSEDYKLYAIYSTSKGLAESPWPKFHQNNQNTGFDGSACFLSVVDQLKFDFCNPGETVFKQFEVSNYSSKSITLNNCTFDQTAFSLATTLPVIIPTGTKSTLTATIQPDSTGLYQSTCQLTYEAEGQSKTSSGKVSAGLFLDDDSELAYTAHRSLATYDSCRARDVNSIATTNNLGVIYRLLGETGIAEQNLMSALSKGLNAKYGYTGIKMNLGVIKSDQGQATKANDYYAIALKDVAATASQSALAPQLYYNQAWEAYIGDKLAEALTQVDKAIAHTMANDFLKAKAYLLRGAILYRQGNRDGAKSDFRQAIVLDPDGPIGRMAQWNLQQTDVNDRDDGERIPRLFVLQPNFPNPFNPETTISFGLPRACKVDLVIYNVLGQKVHTLFNGYYQSGWYHVSWKGSDDNGNQLGSGVYLLQMKTDDFESTHKMTLVR